MAWPCESGTFQWWWNWFPRGGTWKRSWIHWWWGGYCWFWSRPRHNYLFHHWDWILNLRLFLCIHNKNKIFQSYPYVGQVSLLVLLPKLRLRWGPLQDFKRSSLLMECFNQTVKLLRPLLIMLWCQTPWKCWWLHRRSLRRARVLDQGWSGGCFLPIMYIVYICPISLCF